MDWVESPMAQAFYGRMPSQILNMVSTDNLLDLIVSTNSFLKDMFRSCNTFTQINPNSFFK